MDTYSTRDEAVERIVVASLGEYSDDFDVEAIADEVITPWPVTATSTRLSYGLAVDVDGFWAVVARHAL